MRGFLILAALAGLVGRLSGQAAPPVSPGTRVQVRILTESGRLGRAVEGTVERMSRDSLILLPKDGGPSQAFPAVSGTVLSVFDGRRSSLTRGAIIGGFAGLATGGLVAAFASTCSSSQGVCFSRDHVSVRWGLILAGGGTVTGLLIGSLTSHDSWATTSGPSAWPYLAMGARGLGAGLCLSF